MKRQRIGTQRRLLEAAIRLFSKKGYDGTTVDEIVEAAAANKRMVYHYFGSKDAIYQEVLKEVFGRLQIVELATVHPGDPIETTLEALVRAYFDFLSANPEFVHLLLWENLGKGRHLEPVVEALSKAPLLDLLSKVLRDGVSKGRIRKGFDARHLLINLIGLCLIYFSNRHTLTQTVGLDLKSPAVLETGVRQVVMLLKYGILKKPTD